MTVFLYTNSIFRNNIIAGRARAWCPEQGQKTQKKTNFNKTKQNFIFIPLRSQAMLIRSSSWSAAQNGPSAEERDAAASHNFLSSPLGQGQVWHLRTSKVGQDYSMMLRGLSTSAAKQNSSLAQVPSSWWLDKHFVKVQGTMKRWRENKFVHWCLVGVFTAALIEYDMYELSAKETMT